MRSTFQRTSMQKGGARVGGISTLAFACVLTAVVGCAGDAGGRPALSIRDSAGIRIVTSARWPDNENPFVRVSDDPLVVIGGNEPGRRAEEQFSYISGLLRLSDGSIAVANSGSFEVRIFDRTGQYVRSLGRPGQGPGEFQSLFGIYKMGRDSIAAFDTQSQSMTIFTPGGEVGRTFTITGSPSGTRVTPVGLTNWGRGNADWLMIFSQNMSALSPGPQRPSMFVARFDQKGALVDTLATVPGFEVFVLDNGKPGGRIVPNVLFGRGATVAATPHGFVAATNDLFELGQYNMDGHLEASIRYTTDSRPVTALDVGTAREDQLDVFRSPEQKALLTEAQTKMPSPMTMPAFGTVVPARNPWIVVNQAGGFWVLNYMAPKDDGAVWSIFDPSGKMVGNIAMHQRFVLYEAGSDYVLGTVTDDSGVERVVMYGLVAK